MGMKINLSNRQWTIAVLLLLLATYAVFQARFLLLGPQISIENPRDGALVSQSIVTISGMAYNVSRITLNGRQIFTDQSGAWEEKLLVSPGVSIMTVEVRDRFGRESEESVRVIYNP